MHTLNIAQSVRLYKLCKLTQVWKVSLFLVSRAAINDGKENPFLWNAIQHN